MSSDPVYGRDLTNARPIARGVRRIGLGSLKQKRPSRGETEELAVSDLSDSTYPISYPITAQSITAQ
jgi:hypothetical protein